MIAPVEGLSGTVVKPQPTECVWAEILVAMGPPVLCLVHRRVTGHVLWLLLLLLPAEHLVEKAELGGHGAGQGQEENCEDAHCIPGGCIYWGYT